MLSWKRNIIAFGISGHRLFVKEMNAVIRFRAGDDPETLEVVVLEGLLYWKGVRSSTPLPR